MKKKKRHSLPHRVWYGPDKMRAAYLAGQGMSSREIALAVGGTTGSRIRAMLNSHGIPLMRSAGNEDVLSVRWKRGDREALNKAASRLDREPEELAALIIRKVLASNPKLLSELVHEHDVI